MRLQFVHFSEEPDRWIPAERPIPWSAEPPGISTYFAGQVEIVMDEEELWRPGRPPYTMRLRLFGPDGRLLADVSRQTRPHFTQALIPQIVDAPAEQSGIYVLEAAIGDVRSIERFEVHVS